MAATSRKRRSLAAVLVVAAALPIGMATSGNDAEAADPTYPVAVPNASFETPAVTASSGFQQGPSGGTWQFNDTAGITRGTSTIARNVPTFPNGSQVAYVQDAGKIVLPVWVEPGDVLGFRATQMRTNRSGLQSIAVLVDGVSLGSLTPADGTWGSYSITINVPEPRKVNLEIRGLTVNLSENRAALIDAVTLTRRAVTIPDGGLPGRAQRGILAPKNVALAGGVLGVLKTGDSEPGVDTPVQAFAEWNDVMFVGGKFAQVQRGAGGTNTSQPYLAAFDRATGAWIDSFRPRLDGTVWDLAMTADGKLIVAGQFTNVNGAARTAGLAALDPATGNVVSTWTASLQLTGATARPYARALDVVGDDVVYVAGNFSRVITADGVGHAEGRLAKLSAATGRPVNGFGTNIGGSLIDVDATPSTVYVVGQFTTVNGTSRTSYAVLDAATGTLVPGHKQMLFTTTSSSSFYQQAVLARGADVWIGGSEHSTQLYTASDTTRRKVFTSNPYGDIQTMRELNGYLYVGSHASPGTFEYTDATHFTALTGWTTRDAVRWIGVVDLATNTWVPTFQPAIGMEFSEGIWELTVDSAGCMWAGGDIARGSSTATGYRYARGFTKFCPVDDVAPGTPPNSAATRTASGVSLTWRAAGDDRNGDITYDVLKNDRVIATGITGRSFTDPSGTDDDRYFLRAVDAAGNMSATTRVLMAGVDNAKPSAPTDLSASAGNDFEAVLTWTASTDNVGVTGYKIYRSGIYLTTVDTVGTTLGGQPTGQNSYQVSAIDAAGNESSRTASVTVGVTGTDTTKPSAPRDLSGAPGSEGEAVLTWGASTDNVGVTGYRIYRSGVLLTTVTSVGMTLTGQPTGPNSYQVSAIDAAGNESTKTASVTVTVAGPDVTKPSAPRDLAGAPGGPGEAVLTWTASTDNVGVTGYRIYRSNALITTVATPGATLVGQPTGPNGYQVSAIDAAGNESARTTSITVTVGGSDTTRPTSPKNFSGAPGADGEAVLSWTASTDNVGVTGYRIYRSGVLLTTVTTVGTTLTGQQVGPNSYQVSAVDASGNESAKTASITVVVTGPDVTRPTSPKNFAAAPGGDNEVVLGWSASRDNVGVTGYRVFRTGTLIATVSTVGTTLTGQAVATASYQVAAIDAAGNQSAKTVGIDVTVTGPDVTKPTSPKDLAAVQSGTDATLTWTASRDNVGVTGYDVFDKGVFVMTVSGPAATITAPRVGTHRYSVQAFDAAGNRSSKTAEVALTIV